MTIEIENWLCSSTDILRKMFPQIKVSKPLYMGISDKIDAAGCFHGKHDSDNYVIFIKKSLFYIELSMLEIVLHELVHAHSASIGDYWGGSRIDPHKPEFEKFCISLGMIPEPVSHAPHKAGPELTKKLMGIIKQIGKIPQ